MKKMGERISSQRKLNGYSQEMLAELVGVSRQTIYKWEADLVVPTYENIIKLCNIFQVDSDYFYSDELRSDRHVSVKTETYKSRDDALKRIRRKILIVFAVFVVCVVVTTVLGFITITPNKGDIQYNSDEIDRYIFYIALVVSVIQLIVGIILIILYMKRKKGESESEKGN